MDDPSEKLRVPPAALPNKRPRASRQTVPDAAFDLWLRRGLHAMFDDVAREPVPEALLKLIEQDRTK